MLKPDNAASLEHRNSALGPVDSDGAFPNLSGFYPVLWVAAALVALVLFACNLLMGDLNQDEGWYLYAARLVTEGRLPYIDFATTQGPVMPFVYAIAQPLVDHWGVAGGRLFTAALGLLSCLAAAWLAAMLAPARQKRAAAFIVFILIAINVYQSYFFTAVKTYSLAALLIASGFAALALVERGRGALVAIVSGVLLALAAGTRISALVILPIVLLCLLFARRLRPAFWFCVGAGLTLVVMFVPFALKAPESLKFALYDYHAARATGGLVHALAYKLGFVSRVAQAYFVALGAFIAGVLYMALNCCSKVEPVPASSRPVGNGFRPICSANVVELAIWLSVLAVTLVHFCAPFPYDDYQAPIFPLFAVAVACMLLRLVPGPRAEAWLVTAVFILCVASAFSSPMNQKWFMSERDRIWWPMKDQTPLKKLAETAQCLRNLTKPGDTLLTQDPYLAVESGLSMPRGLEMGPFSYFPGWSREKAAKLHVLNKEMLKELVEGCDAPVAAFSGYGLAIQCPSITEVPRDEEAELWRAVEKRYSFFRQVEDFGQAGTRLKIYLRK
jgi:hypothetical protein